MTSSLFFLLILFTATFSQSLPSYRTSHSPFPFSPPFLFFLLLSFFLTLFFFLLVEWRWVAGSNETDDPGNYFVGEGMVRPPGRSNFGKWEFEQDGVPKLLFYSGSAINNTLQRYFADMWLFNPSLNEFEWLGGINGSSPTPILPSSEGPGSRIDPLTWRVGEHFYLYGGRVTLSTNEQYSDLWEFNITSLEWTLLSLGFGGAIDCGTNNLGRMSGGALWSLNDTEHYFAAGIQLFTTSPFVQFNYGVWKWDNQDLQWKCLKNYDGLTQLNGVTAFRNFTASKEEETPSAAIFPNLVLDYAAHWILPASPSTFPEDILVLSSVYSPTTRTVLYGFSPSQQVWTWLWFDDDLEPINPKDYITGQASCWTQYPDTLFTFGSGSTLFPSAALWGFNYTANLWEVRNGLDTVGLAILPNYTNSVPPDVTPGSRKGAAVLTIPSVTRSAAITTPQVWIIAGSFYNDALFFNDVFLLVHSTSLFSFFSFSTFPYPFFGNGI